MSKAILGDLTTLSVIPWFHSYGLLTLIGMTIGGRTLVTLRKYEDKLFLSAIEVRNHKDYINVMQY